MNSVPCLPDNAPFTAEQRAWVNGFLAGLLSPAGPVNSPADSASAATPAARPLLVAFGSQTGSAQGLARRLAKEAGKRGFAPVVRELNAVTPAELAQGSPCVIITSTWGDGDPPDNATQFWNQLSAGSAPRLDQLTFAVLGLGDRNYPNFCGAAKKLDDRLEQLGARRLAPLGECDVDYEATASTWTEGLWTALNDSPASTRPAASKTDTAEPTIEATAALGTRANPFPARLKANRRLNGPGSRKDTRHFEIVLEGSDLAYEVGDALGVQPLNCPVLVEELLATLGCDGSERVLDSGGRDTPMHEALMRSYGVAAPNPALLQDLARRDPDAAFAPLLVADRKPELDQWLRGRDLVDALKAASKARLSAVEFVAHLRPLRPRLYSISSSPKAHPGEVHLTVAAVRYEAHGRARRGVCSTWLADRVSLRETPVPVFVQPAHGFRLPEDRTRPVIMVGPGTGIAPFRAFLEERRATGATGANWLFFGDQHRADDFLYEEEMNGWLQDGLLTHLDLAFSRDQADKVYVQDRMREQQAELWSWLEAGAHFYVCGDAKHMARDVDAALHSAVVAGAGCPVDQAADYVAALKASHRYQRDVY